MGFRTKLDYSSNRQIKQHVETLTLLSGGTSFGVPFNQLPQVPNTSTSAITDTILSVTGTFSGNNINTIYSWSDSRMALGEPQLLTLSADSSDVQIVNPVFVPSSYISIDGNSVAASFTGVTYLLYVTNFVDLGGTYSGTVITDELDILSANTGSFTGRTIWVDTSGITRTDRLIVTNTPVIGNVLTCIDTEGMASWLPASTPPVSTDVFVTGGTYSTGTAMFTNNTGGTFNVTGFSTGSTSSTSYWSAGTGTNAIVTINSSNHAGGDYASSQGFNTYATGDFSHAEGFGSQALGNNSHAEGGTTIASGFDSHAEGESTLSSGIASHSEGRSTSATTDYAHSEGWRTTASGVFGSHAEGYQTLASGLASHSQGADTQANGNMSHAGGSSTIANGIASFVHGSGSTVNGNYSIVLGRNITGNTDDTTFVNGLNIKNVGAGSSVNNLGIDANGFVVIGVISSGGTSGTDIFVTGGTYSAGTATFRNNSGGTFNVSGFATSGGANYWAAGTGTNSILTIGGGGTSTGDYSLAEGRQTNATWHYAHAEGYQTTASGQASHAEGWITHAYGTASHAEGLSTTSYGIYSHAEGNGSIASGFASHAEGGSTQAIGDSSHAEGGSTQALGDYSHAEGQETIAGNDFGTHAEGGYTQALGRFTHAEGIYCIASGWYSHAEGSGTTSTGLNSHAEGHGTIASGMSSHAQGDSTIAGGFASHASGSYSKAFGSQSFAGGLGCISNGDQSFVYGTNSVAQSTNTIVFGVNITGSSANTTYVDNLNIRTIPAGPGTIDLGINAGGFVVNQASDIRLKENISTIDNALEKVMNLRGVTYNWIDRVNGGDSLRIGFIAQEVQEIEPLLITENGEYLGVQYKDVPALLVEAMKELVSGNTKYSKTYLETQTILAEDNNIELNYNGTLESSIGGGVTIIRGEENPSTLTLNENGNWVSNVNILSKGFIIPEYTPINSQDSSGIVGNIVQDDDYIYIKRNSGWKRTTKLENF